MYRLRRLGEGVGHVLAPKPVQNGPMLASRSPWSQDDPDVFIAEAESVVKKHPHYSAAKAGSIADAWDLADSILSGAPRHQLDALMANAPTLVPVHAFEGLSINGIPAAMAQWLAGEYGTAMAVSIVQINKVGHTGSSGWNRMANQALFEGDVIAGRRYVLVDDFVGQGGTLANLRGYIMEKGGLVSGFVSLTGNQARSAKIASSPRTLSELRSKHADLEPWWRARFGFGFDALTESEALYILRFDAQTVRDRISAAGLG